MFIYIGWISLTKFYFCEEIKKIVLLNMRLRQLLQTLFLDYFLTVHVVLDLYVDSMVRSKPFLKLYLENYELKIK